MHKTVPVRGIGLNWRQQQSSHIPACEAAGNALWAFSKLGHNPGAGLLVAAAPRLEALLRDATPQNIANWLLPFVTFKVQPPPELLTGVVAVMEASPEARPTSTLNQPCGRARWRRGRI